ncbi:MAG: formylglycine-generating enzyme family protein [Deltaproteobacteria bacterium]|nr:formylglycine-generating enzyme family protein [Deltaproteobacteria bacterium]
MRRMFMAAVVLAGASAALIGSCAEGIVPPEPTEMVEIKTGLTFDFGPPGPCVGDGSTDPCDVSGGKVPTTYPQVQVTIPAFAIDKHEVTNLQYEYCVAAGGCTDPPFDNAVATEQQDYYGRGRFEQFPVVNITWDQASAYCEFVGKRLPNEFEWERVAKGPDRANPRLYPAEGVKKLSDCFGTDFPVSACRNDTLLDAVDNAPRDFVTENGQNINHMFGNAAEWVDTFYAPSVTTCAGDLPSSCKSCLDCEGLSGTEQTQCQQECKTCGDCAQDGGSVSCFYLCEDTSLRTPFCTAYPSGVSVSTEELTADLTDAPTGRMIRGGNVRINQAQACQLRSDYRLLAADADDSKFNVGFRCAKSL